MEAFGRNTHTLPSFIINFKCTANDIAAFRCHYSFPATSSHAYAAATLSTTGHALFRRSSKAVSNAIVRGLEATEIIEENANISELEVAHETRAPPLMMVSSDSLQYEEGFLGAISEKTAVPGPLCLSDGVNVSYLTRILSSRVYETAIESPLQYAPKLSVKMGVEIWLKREDLQPAVFRQLMANLTDVH